MLLGFWVHAGILANTVSNTGIYVRGRLAPTAASWDGKSGFELDMTLLPDIIKLMEQGESFYQATGNAFSALMALSLVVACVRSISFRLLLHYSD